MYSKLSFQLSAEFIALYKDRAVNWGFQDVAGNAQGELVFVRTYARRKPDGSKERWYEVCQRVINGMYSIQKDHCKTNNLPWNDRKAHASAQEAYDRMFAFKWTPPGRGLWMMGTEFIHSTKTSAALQNCSFVSTGDMTKNDPGRIFGQVTEELMLGIGVGWDTKGKDRGFTICSPEEKVPYVVEDSREGWANSIHVLVNAYLKPNQKFPVMDYSKVRPYGEPILGFGGTASGPEPLAKVHGIIIERFEAKVGQLLDTELIADLMNLIGTAVVAGNVRRSAEIGFSESEDTVFRNLKNPEAFPVRNSYDSENPGWAWMSNNSVFAKVGQDYSEIANDIARNGEPGLAWMDVTRAYGRLIDPPDNKDFRAAGYNPCAEQPLESGEKCTLVEVHVNRAESQEDFQRTLKFAYLYGKAVTLMPTHWADTNAIMQRNRRIGTSMTGVAGFVDKFGLEVYRHYADEGYAYISQLDRQYSEWLCVRESIRKTTSKPSGTVSILSGATPGVHWSPGGKYFLRAIRFSDTDLILGPLAEAGYTMEPDVVSANTTVVYFPIKSDHERSEKEVTIFEKINLAVECQKYWSDNGVSATISFDAEKEAQYVETVLRMHEGQLKAVSFLPMGNKVYPQQPYTQLTQEEYEAYEGKLKKIDTSLLYLSEEEAAGEKYCSNDQCII